MELRLLGPVEVHAGGRTITCERPQQGLVLAVLTVEVGRLVSVEALVDRVWGEAPPERARRMLHPHIARIRRMLDAVPAEGNPMRVSRRSGGYMLEAAPERVDLHRFRHLLRRADAPECPAQDRVRLLRQALALWRAEPLAGLSGRWVEQTRQVWQQQRLAAVLAWAEAELEVGNPAAVIDPVTQELAEHPMVEPLAAVLMRALAALGRTAEALECYAAVRRHLADELGVDPGRDLRCVHQTILRGETAVLAQPAPAPVPAPVPPTVAAGAVAPPAQLPGDVSAFTGRGGELSRLDAILAGAGMGFRGRRSTAAAPAICALSGTAGVGKTALAIHWAHRVRDSFPDGQLYVNLRGYDPGQPMAPDDALARFLTALGVPAPSIPAELDDRAARYRTEVAGRRMLIILDNAATAEQVRLLLPGTGTCAVVVTSRDRLAGLVAVQGARRLDLDLLPASEAYSLLRRLIGTRAEADADAAAALAGLCARLPLALRVAAELAVSRQGMPLAGLVDELAGEQNRLDLLDAGGDPHAAVSAVFSWSLRHLPPATAQAFRLLGLHPGADFDAHTLAALADSTLAGARRMLDSLARAHLVHVSGPGRFGMHDLLRAYAVSLTTSADSDSERAATLGRLLDYYLAAANSAMDRLHPAEAHHRPQVASAATPLPDFDSTEAVRAWLEAERPCLASIAAYAATSGWPAHAINLSKILYRYLDGGHHTDALAIHSHAYEAASRTGDLAGQAQGLRGQGWACMRLGRYPQALHYLRRAMQLYSRLRDWFGQARTLTNIGNVEMRLGRLERAVHHQREALALVRAQGDRPAVAGILNNLGVAHTRRGRLDEAKACFNEALDIYREIRDEEMVSGNDYGDRAGEAQTLDSLGTVYVQIGQPGLASECFGQALGLFREVGDRDGEVWALNGLGEAAHAASRPGDALAFHTAALAIATEIGLRDQQARGHCGLGLAHRTSGELAQARLHYQHALTLYTELECPEAEQVRACLAGR